MFCLPTTGVSVCTSVTGFANPLRCLEMSVRKRRATCSSAPRQGVTQQSRLFALAAPLGLPDRAFPSFDNLHEGAHDAMARPCRPLVRASATPAASAEAAECPPLHVPEALLQLPKRTQFSLPGMQTRVSEVLCS